MKEAVIAMTDAAPKQSHIVELTENYLKLDQLEDAITDALGVQNYETGDKDRVLIDLSKPGFWDLGATLWLVVFLHSLQRKHTELQLVLPDPDSSATSANVWAFLFRWRFFETLAACVADPLSLLPIHQHEHLRKDSTLRARYASAPVHTMAGGEVTFKPLQRLLAITPLGLAKVDESDQVGLFLQHCNDRLVTTSLAEHCGWQRDEAAQFSERVLSEGVVNASLHHGQGSFALVAMRLDTKWLTLTIVDNGQGIPHALRLGEKGLRQQTDAELIEYFTDEKFVLDSYMIRAATAKGISSVAGRRGFGLYYLKQHVAEKNGELTIRSGTARVDFGPKLKVRSWDNRPTSPGTLLRVRLPIKGNDADPSDEPPNSSADRRA